MKLRSSSDTRLLCVLLLFANGAWAATAAEATYWQTLGTAGGPPQHAARYQIANALVVGDAVPFPLIGPPGTAALANGLMTANAPTIAAAQSGGALAKPPIHGAYHRSRATDLHADRCMR
jgi:hypothetical protein